MEPQHLLGFVDAAHQRFQAHANGLAELLLGAMHSPDLHVVVFDGINRSPAESWLLPFMHAMSAARRGRNDRGVPLVAHGSVAPEDPFASAIRLQWPPNVLPIGIASQGVSTLPIPDELWRFGAFVDVNRSATVAFAGGGGDPAPRSRVSAERWYAWQHVTVTPDPECVAAAERLVAEISGGTRDVEIAGRMAAVLRGHDLKSDAVLRHSLIPTMVPRFIDAESVLERLAASVGLGSQTEWRSVLDAATRLMQ